MSLTEHKMLAASNSMQHNLRMHVDMLSLSSDFMCPQNMLMQRVRLNKGVTALVFRSCQLCTDWQFWNVNRCQECDTNADACEMYSTQTHSKPCSWTRDLI